jgi:hypothetical protein
MDPKNEDGSRSGTLFFWGPFFNIVICMINISQVFERAANFASSFPHIPRGRLVSVTPTGTEVGLALSCSIVHVRASKFLRPAASAALLSTSTAPIQPAQSLPAPPKIEPGHPPVDSRSPHDLTDHSSFGDRQNRRHPHQPGLIAPCAFSQSALIITFFRLSASETVAAHMRNDLSDRAQIDIRGNPLLLPTAAQTHREQNRRTTDRHQPTQRHTRGGPTRNDLSDRARIGIPGNLLLEPTAVNSKAAFLYASLATWLCFGQVRSKRRPNSTHPIATCTSQNRGGSPPSPNSTRPTVTCTSQIRAGSPSSRFPLSTRSDRSFLIWGPPNPAAPTQTWPNRYLRPPLVLKQAGRPSPFDPRRRATIHAHHHPRRQYAEPTKKPAHFQLLPGPRPI